ncbi:glycosyltransferase family 4 protein [Petrachloros mirabilis]
MDTVCHVITKLELGGAQEVALYAVSHLDRRKFRPVLVTGPGGMLTEEAIELPGVQTIIIPSLGRSIRAFSDLLALFELISLFRRLRPTIVHTHSSKAGILGRWAAWFARVPIVVHTVHGYGVTPAQPALLRRLFVLLERMTGWVTSHWIMVAQVDVEKGRQWRLFQNNVSIVRPGIDPRPFQSSIDATARNRIREEFGARPGDFLVGTVACLKPQKAPEDVVRVAQLLSKTSPDVRFVLIGDGELRPRLEALIRQCGLHQRVRLAGWRRDIDKAMKCFDALLLTSHWEGLPRVILEASAVGLPVVATKVGGVEEVVRNGENARLYDVGDVNGLAGGLEEILEGYRKDPSRRRGLSRELPKEFHIDEMVKQYQTLYDRLLSKLPGNLMPKVLGPEAQP